MSYSRKFYEFHKEQSLHSARIIIPIVLDLIQPKSVIDIGCGTGAFLHTLIEEGISDVLGVDGDYIKNEQLVLPKENFHAANLNQPLNIHRKFDLTISLEVGEHLPANRANDYILNLISFSPVVLFSAAIPHQGGTHHINEQWPDYWAKKFAEYNYVPLDCIRPKIWTNPEVSFWYAQNIILYVDQSELSNYSKLSVFGSVSNLPSLSLVHPKAYMKIYHRSKVINYLKMLKSKILTN